MDLCRPHSTAKLQNRLMGAPVYNRTKVFRTIFRKLPRSERFNITSSGKGPLRKTNNTTYEESTADGTSTTTTLATNTAIKRNRTPVVSH